MPKSSLGVKSPNTSSAHGPTPWCGSFEASQTAEQPLPRSRPLRRGPWQRATSPPRPRARGHPRSANELRLVRGPLGQALREALARGNSASFETPLGRLGRYPNHPTGLAHLLLTTPRHGAGVRRRQQPCRTANRTGVPSACSCHCAAIPSAVRICSTLCGHV